MLAPSGSRHLHANSVAGLTPPDERLGQQQIDQPRSVRSMAKKALSGLLPVSVKRKSRLRVPVRQSGLMKASHYR